MENISGAHILFIVIILAIVSVFGFGNYILNLQVFSKLSHLSLSALSQPLNSPSSSSENSSAINITSVSPESIIIDGSDKVLTITGSGFTPKTVTYFSGSPLLTKFDSTISALAVEIPFQKIAGIGFNQAQAEIKIFDASIAGSTKFNIPTKQQSPSSPSFSNVIGFCDCTCSVSVVPWPFGPYYQDSYPAIGSCSNYNGTACFGFEPGTIYPAVGVKSNCGRTPAAVPWPF